MGRPESPLLLGILQHRWAPANNSSRVFAQALGTTWANIQQPVKVYTLSRTSSGTTRVQACPCWSGPDKTWSTGKGHGKPLRHSCLENPMSSMERQKDMTLKDGLPRSLGAQYSTGEEQRNNYRKNEEAESKRKQHPVVIVSGGESKVWCCKQQYCIGNWNVRSMNQGKLDVV